MSLEDVGKRMGIDKTAISRIERGLTPYDQIHLQQMSEIYSSTRILDAKLNQTSSERLGFKTCRKEIKKPDAALPRTA